MAENKSISSFDAFPLSDSDRRVLSMTDEEYKPIDWNELKEIISANRLEQLKRRPSDLRRYLTWSSDTRARYNGITNFVVQERLKWEVLPSDVQSGPPSFAFESPVPFADHNDFKILRNDWPYGLAAEITHLCVWTKTPIATDPTSGDVTVQSRKLIEEFVHRTFSAPLDSLFGEGKGKDNVLWFKNWVALQSVRGVDHIHVLLRDVPQHLIDDWVGR